MISLKLLKLISHFIDWLQINARIAFETARIFYSVCETFTKHGEIIKNFRETDTLKQLNKSKLEKFVLVMMDHILTVKI